MKRKCMFCEGKGYTEDYFCYYEEGRRSKISLDDCNACGGTGKQEVIDNRKKSKGRK